MTESLNVLPLFLSNGKLFIKVPPPFPRLQHVGYCVLLDILTPRTAWVIYRPGSVSRAGK